MPNTRQILIVDDDPELRDALSEQLSLHEEFKAFGAEDGRKGVQAAKAGQIDLVIMDVGLASHKHGQLHMQVVTAPRSIRPRVMDSSDLRAVARMSLFTSRR